MNLPGDSLSQNDNGEPDIFGQDLTGWASELFSSCCVCDQMGKKSICTWAIIPAGHWLRSWCLVPWEWPLAMAGSGSWGSRQNHWAGNLYSIFTPSWLTHLWVHHQNSPWGDFLPVTHHTMWASPINQGNQLKFSIKNYSERKRRS